ncbi:AarF/UbiB family protein [Flavobacterium sp. MFBS3-15]|uniref:ABC1 kinase family protein n=1 Tax=Flavobacterium sp. MFBS3-15 TaxID=2989816 RepID=UPI00223611CB|nr:AarF/UbiB family protein [Flavobacterium sp. MFBS3-15]MCW4469062.1 AarF/UbiB family protein [Flavobacterium sp. MFBS3-15]
MKRLDSIPTNKIDRVTRLVTTGVKVGGNYLKYYGKKMVNPELTKDELHQDNAADIYDTLKELKGSALKVAQMLSMEKNLLPQSYVDKFSLSQFSVPPLSAPLVRKTFKNYFGVYPDEMFDWFSPDSVNAASIGQVHKAKKDGKELAVKIQYPGVKESISTDIAIVKPIAIRMFNLKDTSDEYFQEIEGKLMEETDYVLEMEQSEYVRLACSGIPNLRFAEYYPEYSCEKIITMDWMDGIHLSEYNTSGLSKEKRDRIGQALFDFYMFQIHKLKYFHADPHPGNFLVDKDDNLIAIDFGCMKRIPDNFYQRYFELVNPANLANREIYMKLMHELEMLKETDSPEDIKFFSELFHELLVVFTRPLQNETFDFSEPSFLEEVARMSQELASDKTLRKMNGNRGSKHFIYINRTFLGLYNLLSDLKAEVRINDYEKYV